MYKRVLVLIASVTSFAVVIGGCDTFKETREDKGEANKEKVSCEELCRIVYEDCSGAFAIYTVKDILGTRGSCRKKMTEIEVFVIKDMPKLARSLSAGCIKQCKEEKGNKRMSLGYGIALTCFEKHGRDCSNTGVCVARAVEGLKRR